MQHKRVLDKAKKPKAEPRKQLILDLVEDIQKGIEGNAYPIVVGDLNEDSSDQEESGLQHLLDECDLINAFDYRHGFIPSTRNNKRAIDHILVSRRLHHNITRAGIIPQEVGFSTSDHQGLFVDFKPEVLDTRNIPMLPPNFRKLRLSNALKVEWYIDKVLDKAKNQNIPNRLQKLTKQIQAQGFTSELQDKLEEIDEQITSIMLKTEQDLSPEAKPFHFSDIIVEQIQYVRQLKQVIKLKQQNRPDLLAQAIVFNPGIYSLSIKTTRSLKKERRAARADLKHMQENSWEYRGKHLDKLYEAAALQHNKDKMRIIKEIKEREKQKRMYQKIRFVLKNESFSSVNRLGIPKGMLKSTTKEIWDYIQVTPDKEIRWVYIEEASEILCRLREWNILHFNQSSETPLASKEWEEALNPGDTLEDKMVDVVSTALENDKQLHQDSRCVLQEIITNIRKPMSEQKCTISLQEFRQFYKTTPENISSSPSGLHIGHYKAASHSLPFSDILHSIAPIALDNQYSLRRW